MIYNFRSRSYWLRRLENDKRRERVEEFTIEHIMPQNENLSAKWREELEVTGNAFIKNCCIRWGISH